MANSDMMECECGYQCRRDELPWKQTQKTRYHCEPIDDQEDWYETLCPDCGKMESFEEVETDGGAIIDGICDGQGEDR